jgi:hypothetical protein
MVRPADNTTLRGCVSNILNKGDKNPINKIKELKG